jgi:hypothetical protein
MEELPVTDIVVRSDGGQYELLRVPCNDWMYADEILVQVCTACGFEPCIMTLKDEKGNEMRETINAGMTVYLWSCKGAGVPPKEKDELPPGFTVMIGYKTFFKECTIYDANDLEFILERGCQMYGLDVQSYEVQVYDAYYMIFQRKRARVDPPTLATLPSLQEPTMSRVQYEPEMEVQKGTLKVILPDGSAKTVAAKNTSRVITVLHAICSKMGWSVADYSIDLPDGEDTLVRFDCVYEIRRKISRPAGVLTKSL